MMGDEKEGITNIIKIVLFIILVFILTFAILRRIDHSLEKVCYFPKVTQLLSAQSRFQSQAYLFKSNPNFELLNTSHSSMLFVFSSFLY